MRQDIRAEKSVCGASARITGDGERGNNDRAQFNSMRRLLRDIAETASPVTSPPCVTHRS